MKDCKGYLHSVETLGAADGPGVRTVFFLCGCALRCIYCHNIDIALAKKGRQVTPDDILSTALRFREYHGERGGVTFSGGEPLYQAEFLIECLRLLRENGVHSCIDTSGVPFTKAAEQAFSLADYVLLDIKHADAEMFYRISGSKTLDTFRALEYIKRNGIKCRLRQVIVSGYTDSEESALALKRLSGGLEIELLPYHKMGAYKYGELGLNYALSNVEPPSNEVMERLKKIVGAIE